MTFWNSKPHSPSSLDFYPDVFLDYFLKKDFSIALKELARFERLLDTYPWTNVPVQKSHLTEISNDSVIELSKHEIIEFRAPVIDFYHDESLDTPEINKYKVIIWLTNEGVKFNYLEDWELAVLSNLNRGIEMALEGMDKNEKEIMNLLIGSPNLD